MVPLELIGAMCWPTVPHPPSLSDDVKYFVFFFWPPRIIFLEIFVQSYSNILISLHSSNVLYKTISWPFLSLIFIHLQREPENIVATLGTVVYNILIFWKILFISDGQSTLNSSNVMQSLFIFMERVIMT